MSLYLRSKSPATTTLIAGKARVTPIKLQSVSRAELDACVLGCRMGNHYKDILRLASTKVFYYTDSTNVLNWLTCEPKKLSVFVQRRIAEIQTWTSTLQWSHISSDINPADIPTRPTSVQFITSNPLWLQGPHLVDFQGGGRSSKDERHEQHRRKSTRKLRRKIERGKDIQQMEPSNQNSQKSSYLEESDQRHRGITLESISEGIIRWTP